MSMPSRAAARWQALFLEHESSGLTAQAFARHRGVNPKTFAWWRSRLRRERASPDRPAPATFLELQVDDDPPNTGVVVHLDRLAASLRVDCATDLRLVRALLEALC